MRTNKVFMTCKQLLPLYFCLSAVSVALTALPKKQKPSTPTLRAHRSRQEEGLYRSTLHLLVVTWLRVVHALYYCVAARAM